MAAVDPKGEEKYYQDGEPFLGVRNQQTKTGSQKYWFDGSPEENLTPMLNQDTGKMFLDFE